jgi:Activator of Hsp90 ATPase homolog 1-like protein
VGAELTFTYPENTEPPENGEIVELDEPRLFAFTWRAAERESQLLRFELEPDGDGTRLVFTHELPRPDSAKVAAGWQLCLDDLELALAGTPRAEFPEGRWVELHEEYAEQFGVSPESGRQALRERQEAESR